jgi:hypothetical protein
MVELLVLWVAFTSLNVLVLRGVLAHGADR